MSNIPFYTVTFIIAISVLVAVHEYGHYIVGRWAGMKVLRFSIGFGKPLITWVRGKDQTEYCISSIPLGGYVRFLDSREGDIAPEDEGRAFDQRPVWKRILVLLAGPVFNFIFAIFAYWVIFVSGIPSLVPVVGEVEESSYAAEAGLEYGDKILAVGDETPADWETALIAILDQLVSDGEVVFRVESENGVERLATLTVGDDDTSDLTEPGQLFPGLGFVPWQPQADVNEISEGGAAAGVDLAVGDRIVAINDEPISSAGAMIERIIESPGIPVALSVLRDGQTHDVVVVPTPTEINGQTIGRIGITTAGYGDRLYNQKYSATESVGRSIDKTWTTMGFTVRMLGRMLTGDVSVKNISGPISIAQFVGQSAERGFNFYVSILALVSISLGILNLLPIPVLDGGQIVYQTVEWVKGSPMSERAQILGQQVGILALILLMSFAFYNDFARILT